MYLLNWKANSIKLDLSMFENDFNISLIKLQSYVQTGLNCGNILISSRGGGGAHFNILTSKSCYFQACASLLQTELFPEGLT